MKARPLLALGTTLLLVGTALAAEPFPADPPNDPWFAASECPPDNDCNNPTGQWNLFSDDQHVPAIPMEASGISIEGAWEDTIGRPDVVIGILDTGVDYDHEDLRNKVWLNPGELPRPRMGAATCSADDCNGDGVFSVLDFATDNRVSDSNGSGARDRGDLRVFVNSIDDDTNGYVDDISGWDTDDDDGDEFDHRYFGHGTGRSGIAGAETDNAKGIAGVCPRCPLMNVRIDDSFVHTSDGVAKGALYAIDNGAKVLNMALGGTSASRMSRGVFDYATARNVVAVSASANEDSAHQNFQSVFDDVITVGGVTADNRQLVTTWRQKAWFSNFGAHLDVVAPTQVPATDQEMGATGEAEHDDINPSGSGTSSSVPHAAGLAGLIFSEARDEGLTPALSSQEVGQIINRTASDVTTSHGTTYPVGDGWDRWTGYGRIDANAAINAVTTGAIPPEADINSPDWYSLVDGTVNVGFYANARRRANYDWLLEWGAGVEPASFTELQQADNVSASPGISSANRVSNLSVPWDVSALSPGLYTLRLTVEDNLGHAAEDRMAVWVRPTDPQDMPGFPKKLSGSIESLSVALVDLDGDNRLETIFSDGNGEVHALRYTGTELPGFPVHTRMPTLPLSTSPAFDGNAANGEVSRSFASVVGGVAVADADRDGVQEIFAAASDGRLYCWNANGSQCSGFPAAADAGFSRDPYGTHQQRQNNHPEGMVATPALGNLDGDASLEIVVGTFDQKLYVWNANGTRMAPFPIQVFDPVVVPNVVPGAVSAVAPRSITSSAAIADIDADGANEIVVGTNETYKDETIPGVSTSGTGRLYVLEANGTIAPGWPARPLSIAPDSVALVAQGTTTSPTVANLDGDPGLEIISGTFLGDAIVYEPDATVARTLPGTFGSDGAGGNQFEEETPETDVGKLSDQPSHFYVSQGAIGQFDIAAGLDYLTGTVGNGIATSATDPGTHVIFDHLLSAWDATTGATKPAFPRVMEDWQFLNGPAIAEISGDPLPEAIQSSGGFYVHAFNATGMEPAGWPKLTGQWQVATPAVGDLDGDGSVEVVQPTRMGTVFAWSMSGTTCQTDQWRKARHDEWNTGAYGTDTRRPNRITDFATEGTRFSATFTAPGDDGGCGTAAGYQVRVSRQEITEASFSSATPVAAPSPAAAGTAQSHTFSAPSWARFVGIRATDEAGNAGPVTSTRLCTQVGTSGDDQMRGTTGDDIVCGGDGNDTLKGLRGADVLIGGLGRDILRGQRGRDVLLGQGGRDRLFGGRARDRLVGGPSRDRLVGGRGDDVCRGGPALDRVTGC